jgi:hypothetical protein
VWPLGSTVCVNNHKTLKERIQIAQTELVEKRGCEIPVFVDTMENDFNSQYDAWPERFYIIEKRAPTQDSTSDAPIIQITEIAMPSDQDKGFDREEIPRRLEWLLDSQAAAKKAKLAAPAPALNPA